MEMVKVFCFLLFPNHLKGVGVGVGVVVGVGGEEQMVASAVREREGRGWNPIVRSFLEDRAIGEGPE